jgi:hypothetical protein
MLRIEKKSRSISRQISSGMAKSAGSNPLIGTHSLVISRIISWRSAEVPSVIHKLESGFCIGLTSAFMTRVEVELARKRI